MTNQTKKQPYTAPGSVVLEMRTEGPLCQSGEVDTSLLKDMTEDSLFEEIFIF